MVQESKGIAQVKKRSRKMELLLIFLKIVIGIPVGYFATDAVMQNISYSFYKGDRQLKEIKYEPEAIQINY